MHSSKLERDFQRGLIGEIKARFPGCMVMKLDAGYLQGVPDLLILWGERWAALECKRSLHAAHRPNQDYYVAKMDGMSFSRFVSPENKEEVMDALERAFESERVACLSGGKQVPLDQLHKR